MIMSQSFYENQSTCMHTQNKPFQGTVNCKQQAAKIHGYLICTAKTTTHKTNRPDNNPLYYVNQSPNNELLEYIRSYDQITYQITYWGYNVIFTLFVHSAENLSTSQDNLGKYREILHHKLCACDTRHAVMVLLDYGSGFILSQMELSPQTEIFLIITSSRCLVPYEVLVTKATRS